MATETKFLAWCARQVGVQESPRGSNKTPYAALAGHPNGQPWCATGLVAGAKVVGLDLPEGADTPYTPAMESAFKRAGRLGIEPRVGAFGFVFFPNMKPTPRVAHVFAVWKVTSDWVYTIEFNSNTDGSREGREVAKRRRPNRPRAVGETGPRSYGYPWYRAAPPAPIPVPVPASRPEPPVQEDDMQLSDSVPLGAAYTNAFPEYAGKQIDVVKGSASLAHVLVATGLDARRTLVAAQAQMKATNDLTAAVRELIDVVKASALGQPAAAVSADAIAEALGRRISNG